MTTEERQGRKERVACAVAWILAVGCGSDPAPPSAAAVAAPSAPRTLQEPIAQACTDKITVCWDAEVKKNAALGPLAAAVTKPFQAAGAIEDGDSNRLVWAEFAPTPDAARADIAVVWGLCKKDGSGCSAGTAVYTPTGAAITDAAGKAVDRIGVGLPVLRKQLKAHAPDKDPTLLAPLSQSIKVDAALARLALQKVKAKTRRLVIFNAYGAQVGLSAAPVAAAANAAGVFDSVEVIEFARVSDLSSTLPSLTAIDAVVWIGASVQEIFSDKSAKPLGLTVSRGVFGDQMIYGKTLPGLLDNPPLGGPGLVVLVASNALSADYMTDATTIGHALNAAPARAVVGFGGKVAAADALDATAAFLKALCSGSALDAAMAASPLPLLTAVDKATRPKWLWPGKRSAFWGAKAPSKAAMTLPVRMDPPYCTYPITPCTTQTWKTEYDSNKIPADQLTAGHATFNCPSLEFDGPFFSCATKDANSSADFSVVGVMRGRGAGDRFWIAIDGTANTKYKQMFVVGEGLLDKTDQGGGKSSTPFSGLAAAAAYVDESNNCCAAGGPALTTIKGEPGLIEIWP